MLDPSARMHSVEHRDQDRNTERESEVVVAQIDLLNRNSRTGAVVGILCLPLVGFLMFGAVVWAGGLLGGCRDDCRSLAGTDRRPLVPADATCASARTVDCHRVALRRRPGLGGVDRALPVAGGRAHRLAARRRDDAPCQRIDRNGELPAGDLCIPSAVRTGLHRRFRTAAGVAESHGRGCSVGDALYDDGLRTQDQPGHRRLDPHALREPGVERCIDGATGA